MGAGTGRRLWAFCSIVLIAALIGCTTNITPSSGPVGTEICFDPAPIRGDGYVGGELITCGWWVYFLSGDTLGSTYTYENCVDIPTQFSPGDEISITINGDWGGGLKCEWIDYYTDIPWVPGYKLFGSFVVTE